MKLLDWTIERDSQGEAMVCAGCGTTRMLDHIRYISPKALSCCPERKMVPVRQALADARNQTERKAMQHVAYFDEGQFQWMSGIAPRDCELFAPIPERKA